MLKYKNGRSEGRKTTTNEMASSNERWMKYNPKESSSSSSNNEKMTLVHSKQNSSFYPHVHVAYLNKH